jgi:hypothetical protein
LEVPSCPISASKPGAIWDRITYLFVRVINISVRASAIFIFIILVIILIVKLIKLIGIHIVTKFFELKGLASEPVDGAGDKLLLDIFSELVVEFETLLDIRSDGIIVIRGGLRGGEEVEKGLCWYCNLDNTSLFCVC